MKQKSVPTIQIFIVSWKGRSSTNTSFFWIPKITHRIHVWYTYISTYIFIQICQVTKRGSKGRGNWEPLGFAAWRCLVEWSFRFVVFLHVGRNIFLGVGWFILTSGWFLVSLPTFSVVFQFHGRYLPNLTCVLILGGSSQLVSGLIARAN